VPQTTQATPGTRHSTARVAHVQGVRRSELPGWFWVALGCMTVLAIGLSAVFLMNNQSSAPPPAATSANVPAADPTPAAVAPGAAVHPSDQRTRAAGIQIEPVVRPPAPPEPVEPAAAPVAARQKAARPLKVARSPGTAAPKSAAAGKPAAAARPAADEDDGEDEPKPAKPRAATAAQDDSEEK
jgi:hypothetical protein